MKKIETFVSKSGNEVKGTIIAFDSTLNIHCILLAEESKGFNGGVYVPGDKRWIQIQKM